MIQMKGFLEERNHGASQTFHYCCMSKRIHFTLVKQNLLFQCRTYPLNCFDILSGRKAPGAPSECVCEGSEPSAPRADKQCSRVALTFNQGKILKDL